MWCLQVQQDATQGNKRAIDVGRGGRCRGAWHQSRVILTLAHDVGGRCYYYPPLTAENSWGWAKLSVCLKAFPQPVHY